MGTIVIAALPEECSGAPRVESSDCLFSDTTLPAGCETPLFVLFFFAEAESASCRQSLLCHLLKADISPLWTNALL